MSIIKTIINIGKKHSTKLLAGGAIVSEIAGFWLMHKRAPIVRQKLDELPPSATPWDKIKVAGPIYLPAALMLLTSGGCIVGGCMVGEAKLAEMTSIAMATDAMLAKSEQKLIEAVGPEKAQTLHEEMAKEVLAEKPVDKSNIIATTHGVDVFCDPLVGRLFTSSEAFIQQAVNKINAKITTSPDMWQKVNDFYDELDLPHAALADGFAWNPDYKLRVDIAWDDDPDLGRPVGTLCYFHLPRVYDNRDVLKG